jgi:malonate decarboxylase beta subunit
MITSRDKTTFLNRQSFLELDARGRAAALFDQGTSRELLGPFDRVESPWLAIQDVTPQEDDGCVVMKGKIAGKAAVVVALEGAFQGGSMGEVSGEKMAAALDLASADSEKGTPTSAVILLETGGVRLQEANLGLAAVAEIMASVLTLRKHAPVICVSAGTVGCFGGMSLAAGLSSYIILTREARLGLNGPEVIEQESGVEEWDSSNRALVFDINGGEQRYAMGLADALVEDDTPQIADAVRGFIAKGLPKTHRSSQVELYRSRIAALDTSRQWDPNELRHAWGTSASQEDKR